MSARDRYAAYVTTCAAGGVLPCSYETFAADEARACPATEARIPASVAVGASGAPSQGGREGGHLMQAQSTETCMDASSASGLALGAAGADDALTIGRNALMALARQVMAEDVGEADDEFLNGRAHGIGSLHAEILRRAGSVSTPAPALALAAMQDGAKDAELADILNTTLWLYRRLPQAYGNPLFVDQAILKMAERLELDDVPAAIKERATLLANSSTGAAS